ncbi:MAG: alpha/beta hydrolase [Pseudomonadota bacterium]
MTILKANLALGAFAALASVPIFAQNENDPSSLSPTCIREVTQLCRQSGSGVRSCLTEKGGELSSECADQVREFAQARGRGDGQGHGRGRGEGQGRGQRGEGRGENGRERGGNDRQNTAQYDAKVRRTIFFGSHPNQQIDIYMPDDAVDDLPLILFVHGGGWSAGDNKYVQAKPSYYTGKDYAFASTGYRLLPAAPVEQQAEDVGMALNALVQQATSIGIDADNVVLMGHSAGAHLAALVASDPQYAGDAFNAISGVVLLDGAGYDVASNIASAKPAARDLYLRVFSNDPERHRALSPLAHIGGKDAPKWLALYVEQREVAREQSESLAKALVDAGSQATALPIANTDHSRMNRELGTERGAAQTKAVDAFLASIFE